MVARVVTHRRPCEKVGTSGEPPGVESVEMWPIHAESGTF